MKHIINFVKGIVVSCWILIAIITTVYLISLNDKGVSELGGYSLFTINKENLKPNFNKGDLVAVKKEDEEKYNQGDMVFFYLGNTETQSYINLAPISSIDRHNGMDDVFHFNETKVNFGNIIGSATIAVKWPKAGYVLDVFSSRWGFMFLIILPTLFAIVYEIYYIAIEVRRESKRELKELRELRKYKEEHDENN